MRFRIFVFLLVTTISLSSYHKTFSQILNYETSIYIDKGGRKTVEKKIRLQINNKENNWLSHIEINYDSRQDFLFNYAMIFDSSGNKKRTLKKKELITKNDLSYQAFYQDDLITEFDLYWNQYPYLLEYSYKITEEEYLYVARWTPLLFTNVTIVESSLKINVPADYIVHIEQSDYLTFSESKVGERRIYFCQSSMVKNTKEEICSPPIKELIPMVSVVPSKFTYGGSGSSDSWQSFGFWLNNLNDGTDQLPISEKKVVKKLIEGIEDKNEIIKKIYYYLQDQTRYINVTIDVGGLKSYPASYVCQNKYGDCKALTTYMKSMLSSVGIKSFYTVLNAGINRIKINPNFPSQQFNHVILAIPFENDTVWLENTSNSLPYNYLGAFTQNRYALVVSKEKSRLVRTPKLQPSDVLVQREYVISIDEGNIWQSDITLTLRGTHFEDFRYSISNRNESDQKMEIINHVDIDGFDLNSWKTIKYHRDSNNVEINVTGNFQSPIRNIGNWEVINPLKIIIPDFENPSNRHLDVRINYPINKSDIIVYEIKNLGKNEVKLPEGTFIKSNYGEYSTSYLLENNIIVVHEKFMLMDNDISVDNYPEFYSFIQSIIDHKKKSAILIK